MGSAPTEETKPKAGVSARRIEILDNATTQHVDFVSYDQVPLSAILALDMSSSVAGERLNDLRRAAAALVAARGLKKKRRWSRSVIA